MRPVYFCLGWLFFSLGMVGVFLPVIPTSPFLILALWAFSNSSRKFHDWLYHHRWFGPPLQKWQEHRVIPLVAKVFAISGMLLSLTYVTFFTPLEIWLKVTAGLFMATAAIYILSKPSQPPN
ncbi:MAG: YbaN family protein [Xanthomonadales bacterium]|nr:YbaN family protein [Xanthomonadales bacterium]